MPKNKDYLRYLFLLSLVAFHVAADQISKHLVREKVDLYENISLIKNHFTLTKVENTGAFLSLGDQLPGFVRLALLSLLPIGVLAFGLFYLFSHRELHLRMQLALSCLIGGGIGNVYDRLRFGSVTDFLHIDFGLFRTGVFNLADVSIMTGIGLLLLHNFLAPKAQEVPAA